LPTEIDELKRQRAKARLKTAALEARTSMALEGIEASWSGSAVHKQRGSMVTKTRLDGGHLGVPGTSFGTRASKTATE